MIISFNSIVFWRSNSFDRIDRYIFLNMVSLASTGCLRIANVIN